MCFLFKLDLLVIWLGYVKIAYGWTDSKCINGSYRTEIIIEGKPKVELQVQYENIYVDDDAFFKCKVRANPAAEIFWLYEGRFITSEDQRSVYFYSDCNATLIIRFAVPRDTGRYSCMARNSYGETTSNLTILAVQQRAKYKANYKSASIETFSSHSCNPEHENMTLKCKHNDSQGICMWKRNNTSINEEKISYCDDMMCCVSIRGFLKEDAGPYTCFMHFDVRKADVVIPQPQGNRCNTGDDLEQSIRKDRGNSTGKASINENHIGVWFYGVIALLMTVF